jgi:phage replication O-like protein O
MKSPQKENGFTAIANELLEQIIGFEFSKRQLSVVLCVIRMTYGYNKKSDSLSGWQIAEMTNLDRSDVSKTIKELTQMNVIIKHETGRQSHGVFINEISINKNYDSWSTVGKTPTVGKLPPLVKHPQTVGDLPIRPLVKHPTHKDNTKDIPKDIELKTYLSLCKEQNKKAIPESSKIFEFCEKAKIPSEFLVLAWNDFRDHFLENEKKQSNWVLTFTTYVKNNYLKVWYFNQQGECLLTSKGVALQNYLNNKAASNG